MRFRMLSVNRDKFTRVYFSSIYSNTFSVINTDSNFRHFFVYPVKQPSGQPLRHNSPLLSHFYSFRSAFDVRAQVISGALLCRYALVPYSCYASYSATQFSRPRTGKKSKSLDKPTRYGALFQQALSMIPPRFTAEELCNVITVQEEPLVCLKLFNWASEQPRFVHDVSTYHIIIKKLGAARLYEDMDIIVNKLLDAPHIGSEALFNTVIYFLTEDRKLTKAVNIYKHMRSSENAESRPSIRTCNLLFSAFLSRRSNSYINHMYMETMRCLFKQMVNDGVKPDIFALNSMIKGYVLSLHINDALRIFHQMDTVYSCPPNSFSYDYLIHGLCAQGRTNNARKLFIEMKNKGFIPSSKSYNSLVNSLALGGEIDEAVNFLWEMAKIKRSADLITYETVVGEICRQRSVGDARRLLKELLENNLVDHHIFKKLSNKLGNQLRD